MKHIDDGTLHAYLDGAVDAVGVPGGVESLERHLEACASCAARLRAERRVRNRANAILSSAAPAVDALPPFGAVVARRTPSGPRQQEPRNTGWRRLAAAASVVLALGVGWTARDLLRPPSETGRDVATVAHEAGRAESTPAGRIAAAPASAPPPAPPRASGASRSAPRGTPDPSVGAADAGVRRDAEPASAASTSRVNPAVELPAAPSVGRIASADPPPPPAPPPPRRVLAREESARETADLARGTAATAAAPSSGRGSPVSGEPAESAPTPAGATIRLRGASTPRTPTLAGRVIDDAGRPVAGAQIAIAGNPAGALSGRDGSYAIPLPADTAEAAEPVVVTATIIGMTADTQRVTAGREDLRRDFVLEPAAISLSGIIVTGVSSDDAGAGWTPVEREKAENVLGHPIATIDGLPVTRFAVSPTRDEVLVSQRLEDGTEVRLVQRIEPQAEQPPAPVDPRDAASDVPNLWLEIDASRANGVSRVTLEGKGLLIEAEAPVPLHRLRSLLLRLR